MLKIPDRVGRVPTLFIASVLIPTAIAALYYGLSSDLYISESHFVVQNAEKSEPSSLGALIKSGGNSSNEGYATRDYILSRDALAKLNRDGLVTRAYGNDSISVLNRFDPWRSGVSRDRLFNFYTKKSSNISGNTKTITMWYSSGPVAYCAPLPRRTRMKSTAGCSPKPKRWSMI